MTKKFSFYKRSLLNKENIIFINENEANPNQKAANVEKFIIENIRLSTIQSADPDFHLGIIIADRKGNVLISSVDGTPQ